MADIPSNFVGFGAGFQASQPSTWVNYCHQMSAVVYGCTSTDVIAGSSSQRAGVEVLLARHGNLIVTMKGDSGVATSGNGMGGSYGAGASVLYDISKLAGVSNTYAAFSVSVLKENLAQPAAARGVLQPLGKQLVFRLGIGRGF